jgi:hypothetical protein
MKLGRAFGALNSWNDTTDPARVIEGDYELTLCVRGGSQVRVFEYDDIGKIWANAEQLKVEGIAPYPDAHEGQFLELGVVSVTPKQLRCNTPRAGASLGAAIRAATRHERGHR